MRTPRTHLTRLFRATAYLAFAGWFTCPAAVAFAQSASLCAAYERRVQQATNPDETRMWGYLWDYVNRDQRDNPNSTLWGVLAAEAVHPLFLPGSYALPRKLYPPQLEPLLSDEYRVALLPLPDEVVLFAYPVQESATPAVLYANYAGRVRQLEKAGDSEATAELTRIQAIGEARWAIVMLRLPGGSSSTDQPARLTLQDGTVLADFNGYSRSLALPDAEQMAAARGVLLPPDVHRQRRRTPREATPPPPKVRLDAVTFEQLDSQLAQQLQSRLREFAYRELDHNRQDLWRYLAELAETEIASGSVDPGLWRSFVDGSGSAVLSKRTFERQIGEGFDGVTPVGLATRLAVIPVRGGALLFAFPANDPFAGQRIYRQHLQELSPRAGDSPGQLAEKSLRSEYLVRLGPRRWSLLWMRITPTTSQRIPASVEPSAAFRKGQIELAYANNALIFDPPPQAGRLIPLPPEIVRDAPAQRSTSARKNLVIVDWSKYISRRREELLLSLQDLVQRAGPEALVDGAVYLRAVEHAAAWQAADILRGKFPELAFEPHDGQTLATLAIAMKEAEKIGGDARPVFITWFPQATIPLDPEQHWPALAQGTGAANPELLARKLGLRILQVKGETVAAFHRLVGAENYSRHDYWPKRPANE